MKFKDISKYQACKGMNTPSGSVSVSVKRQVVSVKYCRLVCCLEMERGSIPKRQTKRQIQVYGDAAAAA